MELRLNSSDLGHFVKDNEAHWLILGSEILDMVMQL